MSKYYDDGPFTIDQWNSLIRDVNDKLANPPSNTDCNPGSPLSEVSDPHLWSVSDVQAVRQAMEGTCPSISFSEPIERWNNGIIDEIESQMGDMWCDCKEKDECYYQCPNAAATSHSYLGTFYAVCLGSFTASRSTCNQEDLVDLQNEACSSVTEDTNSAVLQCGADADELLHACEYAAYWSCAKKVEAFSFAAKRDEYDEDIIPPLEDARDSAQAAKDAACSHVPPTPAACQAATENLANKQAALDAAQDTRDWYNTQYETKMAEAQAQAEECEALLDEYNGKAEECYALMSDNAKASAIKHSSLVSVTMPYWDTVYTLENYKANTLAYNCQPHWGISVNESGGGTNLFAPISGRPIGLGLSYRPTYSYVEINRAAGWCPWPYPPFKVHVPAGYWCMMCGNYSHPTGCTASTFCNTPYSCDISEYAAMYIELYLNIAPPQPQDPYCP